MGIFNKTYVFLLFFLVSCSQITSGGDYIEKTKQYSINWKKVDSGDQSLEGVELIKNLLPIILKTKEKFGLSRNIPNSVLLAAALFETQDGVFYYSGTNNPYNLICYEKHKDGNHCVEVDGRRIRKFKSAEFAVQHESILISTQYNKNVNYKKFITGLLNSEIFVPELNYNYSNLCFYIKTYNLQEYDNYVKKAKN